MPVFVWDYFPIFPQFINLLFYWIRVKIRGNLNRIPQTLKLESHGIENKNELEKKKY